MINICSTCNYNIININVCCLNHYLISLQYQNGEEKANDQPRTC